MHRTRLFLTAFLALFLAQPLFAQTSRPATTADLKKYAELGEDLPELFRQQKWQQAADVTRKQIELLPDLPEAYYNLGCALARMGKPGEAFDALGKAMDRGYDDAPHMKVDEDLASLHSETKFDDLVKRARENDAKAPYEKGEDIRGVKSVEGFPDEGFRYRLRLPQNATPDHPARLVVWLHPAGGSMNREVEALSPSLGRHGFALLVVTRKGWSGWSDEDFDRLMKKTLPDLAGRKEINTDKPVLMGYSAGGQMALSAWARDPAAYGGLVLDAAYPLDASRIVRGQLRPMPLPKGDAAKDVPVFVLVGSEDGGARLWTQVTPSWLAAGIPLTLHVVEEQGHEWLMDRLRLRQLDDWLDQVKQGKKPTDPI